MQTGIWSTGTVHVVHGNTKWYNHFGKQLGSFLQALILYYDSLGIKCTPNAHVLEAYFPPEGYWEVVEPLAGGA